MRLNDSARTTRLLLALMCAGAGLWLGGQFADLIDLDAFEAAGSIGIVGWAVFIGSMIANIVIVRRADARLRDAALTAGRAVLAAPETAEIAPARVVRTRSERTRPSQLLGAGESAPNRVAVFEVLPASAPPRRVSALVPAVEEFPKGAPAVLALSPSDPESAVLDGRVTRQQLDAVAADPRWASAKLPTDLGAAGGGWAMLLTGLVAFVVPFAAVLLVTAFV